MKKLCSILIALSLITNALAQSCLPEGIIFSTQGQIDSFQINYPNCTEIMGDVYIGSWWENDISNLHGLNVVISIRGRLDIISMDTLTNLSGLENLGTIGGGLNINSNNSLTSLTGLEGLTSLGGDIIIRYNNSLISLTGLDNIGASSIDNLNISDNIFLASCHVQSICDYLASPHGTVEIFNNATGCNNPSEVANACGFTMPCLPYGNYYFFSQADIDNFQSNYPGCTQLEGSVQISGNDITNLNGLNVVISIAGNLDITSNEILTGLSGLDNLAFIGEDLSIGDYFFNGNSALYSLTGLNNLDSIGGQLTIMRNDALSGLTGLDNLTSVGQSLFITDNEALTNVTGLGNLASIGHDTLPGDLLIIHNPALTSLTGLDNLTSVGGLSIGQNFALTSLTGLDSIISIGGYLNFSYNTHLISFTGLDNVTSIGGGVLIRGQHMIKNFTGLNNVSHIGGHTNIYFNDSLTSFTGLENLNSMGGDLIIYNNNSLASLTGLDNIEASSIGNLSIRNNISLSTCDVQSICDYLVSPGGTIEIYNNASGCNNPPEVANACGFILPCLPNGDYYFFSQADIDNFQFNYPGCTQLEGSVHITGNDITNLNGLNEVISIGENLNFYNNGALTSLAGLNNLDSIGHTLTIGDTDNGGNSSLTSLTGLNNLTYIGGLWIGGNLSLPDLTGLENFTSIGGLIHISGNGALTSLTGLDNVTTVEGDLIIGDSWEGFGNPALSTLAGLDNLTSVGGSLGFYYNDALTSLTGLNNLNSIGGGISIRENEGLASLTGLENIESNSIESLYITHNQNLSTCEVQSVCEYLANPNGSVYISDNAQGCNSQEEVEEACGIVVVNEVILNQRFLIYPNPSSTLITVELLETLPEKTALSIFNISGQEVITHQLVDPKTEINISCLTNGIYIVKVQSPKEIITQKLVVN